MDQDILDKLEWDQNNLIAEHSYAGIAVYNAKSNIDGHLIVVPLDDKNVNLAMNKAFRIAKEKVESGNWIAFNIAMSHGEAAGQTIDWPHIHIIPRIKGDANPLCKLFRIRKTKK